MKTILLLCLTVATFVWANNENVFDLEYIEKQLRIFEAQIKAKIEALRTQLKAGDPEKGIPSFDPLELQNFVLKQNTEDLKLNLNITGILDGILGFTIDHLKIKIGGGYKLDATLTFPKVKLAVSHYDLDLTMKKMVTIGGEGEIALDFEDFTINTQILLGFNKTTGFSIKEVNNIEFTVGNFEFKITGLQHDEMLSEMVSETVTTNLPLIFIELKSEVSTTVGNLILKLTEGKYLPL